MNHSTRSSAARSWVELGLWVLLIFVTVPFVRAFQEWVADRLGSAAFGWAVVASVVVAAALVAIGPWRGQVPGSAWPWLAAVALVYVLWTAALWGRPEETVHLVEYAVLGILAYRALGHHVKDRSVFLSAALIGSLVGIVDEIIQWITPGRVPDFRDMVINGGAATLIQVAIFRLAPTSGVRASGLRLTCRLALAVVVLLGLCLAATPARIDALAAHIPALGFLAHNPHPMCEYGHAHHDPEIGRFKSRFTIAELDRIDRLRATEVAATLDRYPEGRYRAFLDDITPGEDPFTYEMRVHLHNRNFHLGQLETHRDDEQRRRRHASVARCEHRLLRRYFGTTLARAPKHHLGRWRRSLMAKYHDPDHDFVSKAGIHIITWITEVRLRWLTAAAFLALLGAELYLDRRR